MLYDYQCPVGHVFEAHAPVSEFDTAKRCQFVLGILGGNLHLCGLSAARVILQAPGIVGFDSKSAGVDRRIYAEHNVTRPNGTAEIWREPVSPANQCQCGNCSRHRKREAVTSVADVGKGVLV